MNSAHIHLVLNHIPIFTTAFGLILITLSRLGLRATTLRIGLYTLIAGAAFAVPAYLTGEPAEEIVEHVAGVASGAIDAHEEIASIALACSALLGIIAAFALYRMHASNEIAKSFVVALLALAAVSSSLFGVTAYMGGQIHHTEIAGAGVPIQDQQANED